MVIMFIADHFPAVHESGSKFPSTISSRTTIGYDRNGVVKIIQFDGISWETGFEAACVISIIRSTAIRIIIIITTTTIIIIIVVVDVFIFAGAAMVVAHAVS